MSLLVIFPTTLYKLSKLSLPVIYNLKPPESAIKFAKKDFSNYLKHAAHFQTKEVFKEVFFSNSPPSIFVGSKLTYPKVNVGILTPPERIEDAWLYDAETFWPTTTLSINDIIKMRSSLINSRFQTTVKNTSKFIDIAREIGMAAAPVDVEIHLKKKVKITLDTDQITKPMGPRAPLLKARITENPKVTTQVEKVVSDTDLKAADALQYLYKHHVNENALSQLLSLGVLGLKKNRRLVPTRWSITASDDIITKHLLEDVRDFPQVQDHMLFQGNYFGNYYYVLLFPEVWSYELFEMYLPGSAWNSTASLKASTDDEGYEGRTTYASNCAGGYYASRAPLVQHLHTIKKQASALVLRFETPEYHTGLGVWVVRESMKKTIQNKPITCVSREELITTVKMLAKQKLNIDITELLQRSKLLHQIKEQKKLTSFF